MFIDSIWSLTLWKFVIACSSPFRMLNLNFQFYSYIVICAFHFSFSCSFCCVNLWRYSARRSLTGNPRTLQKEFTRHSRKVDWQSKKLRIRVQISKISIIFQLIDRSTFLFTRKCQSTFLILCPLQCRRIFVFRYLSLIHATRKFITESKFLSTS